MPVVPTYSSGQVGEPSVRPNYQPDPLPASRAVEQGGQALAQGMMAVARGVETHIDRMDEAAAKDLDAQASEFTREKLTGFLGLKGKNALAVREQTEQEVRDYFRELGSQATSQQQQQMFSAVAQRRLQSTLDTIANHSLGEITTYERDSATARATNQAEEALAWVGVDEDKARLALNIGLQEVRRTNELAGGDAETYEAAAREYTSGIHSRAIAAMVSTNKITEAKAYLAANAHEMDSVALPRAQASVAEQAAVVDAITIGDRVWAQAGGDYGDALALAQAAGLEPEVLARVEQRLDTQKARRDRVRADEEGQSWTNAVSLIDKGASPEELPAELRTALSSFGLMGKLEDYARKDAKPEAGGGVYTMLGWMALKDRDAFKAIDLTQYADQMTSAEFLALTKDQAGTTDDAGKVLVPAVNALVAEIMPRARVTRKVSGEDATTMKANAEAYVFGVLRRAQESGQDINDPAFRKRVVEGAVQPTSSERGGGMFFEHESGQLHARDPRARTALIGVLQTQLGRREVTYADTREAIERAQKGKPIVKFDDIPAATRLQIARRLGGQPSKRQVEMAYTAFLVDDPTLIGR